MESNARIRVATRSDAAAVRDIYAPFCESTPVTFEETPPDEDEIADRIASTLETHPWLVCERDGELVGYTYASRLRERRGYQWTAELSVYVADDARATGVGRGLYESLFRVLERQGVCDVYAVVTVPNPGPVAFHERMGFERLAEFPAVGYSNDDWRDSAWWRRSIREKTADPEPITPFSELRATQACEPLVRAGEEFLEW